jgi:hypothetical protein
MQATEPRQERSSGERVNIDNLGIPPLAGLCSYEEACKIGYSVEDNVERLKRYNYVEASLNQMLAAHIPHTPEWEVKCALSLHIWLDAEHSAALRKRVAEMREPPLHLDKVPDARLQAWLEETVRANSTVELLVGIYRVAKPELVRCLKQHLAETNPLIDHPTCRALKQIVQEEEEMIAWGEQAIVALMRSPENAEAARSWEAHLRAFLHDAGGVAGDLAAPEGSLLPPPRWDGAPYEMDVMPQRDARFTNSFDQSHWKYVDTGLVQNREMTQDEIAFALLYRRLREMDVPEYMGPMIYQIKARPWEYYVDMSRQAWDEARHAMMGEVGLYENGMAFYEYPVELEGSVALNTAFDPLEAHVVLWAVEQGLMRRETGKRFEWSLAESSGERLVTAFQDYDWADEVLHAQIGRRWLLPEFGSMEKLHALGDRLKARWFVEMDKLLPPDPPQEWWPNFVADLRRRREQLAVQPKD